MPPLADVSFQEQNIVVLAQDFNENLKQLKTIVVDHSEEKKRIDRDRVMFFSFRRALQCSGIYHERSKNPIQGFPMDVALRLRYESERFIFKGRRMPPSRFQRTSLKENNDHWSKVVMNVTDFVELKCINQNSYSFIMHIVLPKAENPKCLRMIHEGLIACVKEWAIALDWLSNASAKHFAPSWSILFSSSSSVVSVCVWRDGWASCIAGDTLDLTWFTFNASANHLAPSSRMLFAPM